MADASNIKITSIGYKFGRNLRKQTTRANETLARRSSALQKCVKKTLNPVYDEVMMPWQARHACI